MGRMDTFAPAPPAAITRVLAAFDRDQLAGFIEVAIGLLDVAAGDVDLEDATDVEDDFALSPMALHFARGPGCEVSDAAEEHDDREEDDHPGQCTEDEISCRGMSYHWRPGGPGCPISDPGEYDGTEFDGTPDPSD